jgi:predicted small lipoprotein YifL
MKIHSLILILAAASALTACGSKTPSVAPAAPGEASAASSAAQPDAAKGATDAPVQWKKERTAIDAMAQQLADDPALMAKQSGICGSAPAQLQPPELRAPCTARDEAIDIIAKRAQQASGGVKNTGSL